MRSDEDDGGDRDSGWGLAEVGPYRGGRVHVMAGKCDTCIFRPGNLMRLKPGRVKGMVQGAVAEGSCIPCHSTLGTDAPAICRGFWDGHGSRVMALRLAVALDMVTFDPVPAAGHVPPPPPHQPPTAEAAAGRGGAGVGGRVEAVAAVISGSKPRPGPNVPKGMCPVCFTLQRLLQESGKVVIHGRNPDNPRGCDGSRAHPLRVNADGKPITGGGTVTSFRAGDSSPTVRGTPTLEQVRALRGEADEGQPGESPQVVRGDGGGGGGRA